MIPAPLRIHDLAAHEYGPEVWPGDDDWLDRQQPRPSPGTALRVEWLKALVAHYGPDVVGAWVNPPPLWEFEAWLVARPASAPRT